MSFAWIQKSAAMTSTRPASIRLPLPFLQARWIYDLATYTVGTGELGVVSAQTGGWAGEPENAIRLWRLSGESDARLHMWLNTEGADPAAETRPWGVGQDAFCHRRGVHALDYSAGALPPGWGASGLLLSGSEDLLVAWAMDGESGRGREVSRLPAVLDGTPERLRLCADGASVVCAGRVAPGRGLPLLDLRAGLAEVSRLGLKPDGALDIVEIPHAHGWSPLLVAATANRAYAWDRRACTAPSLRLPLAGIKALAAVEADPNALLAAAGRAVLVFDVRKLPPEDPKAKTPPPALARFETAAGAELTRVDAMGAVLVAGDRQGGLHVWDLSAKS